MLKLKLQYFATWCNELTHWKRPWCWERLKAGREGDNRGRDGWMASPTQWTWVWASSGSGWWTEKPGMLQSMGSQRAGHDWATELNWCTSSFDQFQYTVYLKPVFQSYQALDHFTVVCITKWKENSLGLSIFSVTSNSVPGTRLILLKIVGWTQTGVLEKKDQFFIQCIKESISYFYETLRKEKYCATARRALQISGLPRVTKKPLK